MFVLGTFLSAIAQVLDWIFGFLEIIIILRVILSWANADPYNGFVRAIHTISEPLLSPFRRLLPPWRLNGLDLSPVFTLLALFFARQFLIQILWHYAAILKQ